MEFWIKAGQLVLSLSILIVLHEFGHFLPARWFKTRVEKFYLFFNPGFSLFKKKIGETEWGIGWLPLGGYVKISGMIDESMDTAQLEKPAEPWEFRSKPVWQRLIIMTGGVIVNVIVGFLIYILVVAAWGETVIPNDQLKHGLAVNENIRALNLGIDDGDIIEAVDGEPVENYRLINIQVFLRGARTLDVRKPDGQLTTVILPDTINDYMWENDAINAFDVRRHVVVDSVPVSTDAYSKGLRAGDSIVSINGESTPFFHLFTEELGTLKRDSVLTNFGFYRNGELMELDIIVPYNSKEERHMLGIILKTPYFITPITNKFGFGESITQGIKKACWTMHDYMAQLPLIFTKKGASSVGGFGAIGGLFSPVWDWELFWLTTAFISLVLAIMNILPIPALDGGHVMFLLYEMITGREPNKKVMEYAQMVGIILLLGLLLYANGNDIFKTFFK